MTVVPQQYTLHCVTIGDGSYTITVYGNDQQIYSGDCGNEDCIKQLLHSSNDTYDNTVNITKSGSVNSDQIYRCNVILSVSRNRYSTVKGIKLISLHFLNILYI